jgi:threonine/homoserine/homoserine lactone efflux protein
MENVFLVKGMMLGFVIAAPTGPIGILCARRTLTHGRRAGIISGMGAATADAIYGFIAAFGLTFISDLLTEQQFWLRLGGGLLLCLLGIRTAIAAPPSSGTRSCSGRRYAGLYTSTFFLTLTNPMTIFSFAAVFAGFGLAGTRGNVASAGTLVFGVFLGSGLWWLFLAGVFSVFRRRFNHDELRWINRIAGLIITLSGIIALTTILR